MSRLPVTFVLSLCLHGALILSTVPLWAAGSAATVGEIRADPWGGTTFDIDVLRQAARPEPEPASARRPVSHPTMPVPEPKAPPEAAPAKPARRAGSEPTLTTSSPPLTPPAASAKATSATAATATADSTSLAADAQPTTNEQPTNAAAGASGAGGDYGAAGLPPGVRALGRAFARALPAAAASGDRSWLELPLGDVGAVEVTAQLDDEGTLVELELDPTPAPDWAQRLVGTTRLLLRRGRFALGTGPGPGTERFGLRARVVAAAPSSDPFADPAAILERGFRAPTHERPGESSFTLAAGRRVVIELRLLEPQGS